MRISVKYFEATTEMPEYVYYAPVDLLDKEVINWSRQAYAIARSH